MFINKTNKSLSALDFASQKNTKKTNISFKASYLNLAEVNNIQELEHIRQTKISIPLPSRQNASKRPEPFRGTCQELITQVSTTVHRTIDNLDYNGLSPFMKLLGEMDSKSSVKDYRIDSRNKEFGAICSGMAHETLKNLKEEHGIEGTFAIELTSEREFAHAAIIVECQDGYVLIENRANPQDRFYAIPFNQSVKFLHFTITASDKITTTSDQRARGKAPLMIKHNGGQVHRFFFGAVNGDDIVEKNYMLHGLSSFMPIAVYQKEGKPLKDIKISPSRSQVILKNHLTGKQEIVFFDDIRKNGLPEDKIKEFMGKDFHSDPKIVCEQILKFVQLEKKIRSIFNIHHNRSKNN